MKKYIIPASLAASALLSSCINPINVIRRNINVDNGPMTMIVVEAEDFTEIETRDLFDIYYTQGPSKIELHVPEKVKDDVKVYVRNGKLSIGFAEDNNVNNVLVAKAYVSSPDLVKAETTGIGDIYINGNIKTETLNVTSTGTGDCILDTVVGKNISLETFGTGDIEFNLIEASRIYLDTTGTGDVTGKNVNTNSLVLKTSGTGDISVAGKTEIVNCEETGTGDIKINRLKTSTIYKN